MVVSLGINASRSHFHGELDRLEREVLVLGGMVGEAISRSVQVLGERDSRAARVLESEDALINRKRFDIEEATLLLIATQQPMACDLRCLAAILHIVTDLERMGDYAAGIARICCDIGNEPHVTPLVDMRLMSDKAVGMLRRSLDAFVNRDVDAAVTIANEDDEVDALYQKIYRELLTTMVANPRTIDQATHLLWVAHNLERVADRVQNVCERVVFLVTGRMQELSRGPLV